MRRKILRAARSLLVLVLAAGVAAVLIKLRPEPPKIPPPPASLLVEVMPVQASSFTMTVTSYGTVRPRAVLNLIAEVKGQIVELSPNFEEGGLFRRGELLLRVDPRSYQLAVTQKEKQRSQLDAELRLLGQEKQNFQAILRIARAESELALADRERFKTLVEEKVVSQAGLDQAEQKVLAARARVQEVENQIALLDPRAQQLHAQRELVEVQLQEALLDVDRTRITAPFEGWVLEKAVEKGQFVGAGTILGRIYRASGLEVEVRIPFKDLPWLGDFRPRGNGPGPKPGRSTEGSFIPAKVRFETTGRTFGWDGRVKRVLAEVDEKTRTLPIIVAVQPASSTDPVDPFFALKPGMFVQVELLGKRIGRAYLLPRSAIYPGDVVYLANDDHLVVRRVEVLRRLNDSAYITDGLHDGEFVITTPLSAPREGIRLRLRAEGASVESETR